MESKNELRQTVHAALQALPDEHRIAVSPNLCERLRRRPVWHASLAIMLFAPMRSEPDIWPLIAEALAAGKTVALPRFCPATQTYEAACVRDLDRDLLRGRLGIREPGLHCPTFALNRLDLVLVPGVAFDPHGRRLGRGKGYYDRLLADVHGVKCGVAFDEQVVVEVPVGPHDVPLNCIVTPTRWLNC